jgi:hypothetical protein
MPEPMTEQDHLREIEEWLYNRWNASQTFKANCHWLIDEIRRLRVDYASLDESLEAHGKKLDSLSPHGTCGCSYDAPDHLCAHHSPQLTAALQKNSELEAEIYRLRDENERLRIWMVNRSRAILAGEPDEEVI